MPPPQVFSKPLQGKTYSLQANSNNSDKFYQTLAQFADDCLQKWPDINLLLRQLQKASKHRRYLRQKWNRKNDHSLIAEIINSAHDIFSNYTTQVEPHLKTLSFRSRFDWALSTSREQYHLYMLEIELVNRINCNIFLHCDKKIALLPHCLRDFTCECQAQPNDFDQICRACSKICLVNFTSKLLRKHHISPYIWMRTDLKKLFQKHKKREERLGILGIACIPELVRGIRFCGRNKIPVIGIPLDANRCARWMGEFHENTLNWTKMESLLKYNE